MTRRQWRHPFFAERVSCAGCGSHRSAWPKARREVRLARSEVAMPRSRVHAPTHSMLPHRCAGAPQRFARYDAFNNGARASDTQDDALQQRDRSSHRRDACRATTCTTPHSRRAIIASRDRSHHADRSPLRVSASDNRPRRSSIRVAHSSRHTVAFVPPRCRMRRADGRLAQCGHHIGSTRGAIRRHGVHDRLITACDAC